MSWDLCLGCGTRLSHPVEHDTGLCEECGPFVIDDANAGTPTPHAGGGSA
ncbi:hypothetical protein GRX03_12020 [Halovenus sp. WSH3]|uniref:Uncharacterized protein n=1 Tax=Halovenus carboxidivorans TaxID=2692199 RepID=A0A6B0T7Z4_9EURY|nr:hypothetical protein [Halovenus carboxidivorans]MXR52326.1 hypothetical protein [Halovenus carboxidivorans]